MKHSTKKCLLAGTGAILFLVLLSNFLFTRRTALDTERQLMLLSNEIGTLRQKVADNAQINKPRNDVQATSTQEITGSLNLYYAHIPYRGWYNFVLYHRTGPDTEEIFIPDVRQTGISGMASSSSISPLFALSEKEIVFGVFSGGSVFDPVDMYVLDLPTKTFKKMKSKYFQEHVYIENNDGYFLSMGPVEPDGEVRSLYFVNVLTDRSGIIAKLPPNLTYKSSKGAFMPVVQGFYTPPEASGPPEVSIEVYSASVKAEGGDVRLPAMFKTFAMDSPWW